jgi:hypothetical protein
MDLWLLIFPMLCSIAALMRLLAALPCGLMPVGFSPFSSFLKAF